MRPTEWIALLAVVVALVAVWRWRRWKALARARHRELRVLKEALHAMAFESTNAVNAIRANLLDFRQVNPAVSMPEHLDQIDAGLQRIAEALRIAEDPVGWHQRRKTGRPAPAPASQPAAPMIGDPAAR